MNWNLQNLLKISAEIDPPLGESLRKNLYSIAKIKKVSVVNPDVQKFEERLQTIVESVKGINKDLKKALDDLETEEEVDKWFSDELDKVNALDKASGKFEKDFSKLGSIALRISGVEDVAGIKDWVKNKFKKKPKPDSDSDSDSVTPSYQMDESRTDDFVEGKDDWGDASAYIESEANEKTELLKELDDFVEEFKKSKKEKPNTKSLKSLIKKSDPLIKRGEKFVKGVRQHLKEPGAWLPRDSDKPAAKDLGKTVEHYSNILKENIGDEEKTIQSLKEFFKAVEPMLKGGKDSTASVIGKLTRKASEDSSLRKNLLPIIELALSFNS